MQYRKDKYGNPVSALGYGCMRFTQGVTGVDVKKAEREILAAIQAGVNYFDTAYVYPGSEAALGEILEKNGLREKVNIATKLPHYMLRREGDAEKYFTEELKRLRTDHVDYYLMHMLTDVDTWERLKGLGVGDWLEQKKASGEIRQVGFSYHGNSDMFCKLLDAYDWDFCQIQYNYLDENAQAGVTGLKYASKKGLPVVIMEPLRGGKLASKLPADAVRMLEKYPVRRTPAEWAFRWLWNQEEVTCVLSGMNSVEMVEQNVRTASETLPGSLSAEELAVYPEIVARINAKMKVGCTGCRYCMPCPKGVDIPGIFAAYNRSASDGKFWGLMDYMMATTIRKNYTGVKNCIGCGKCEAHCPQHIDIRDQLRNAGRSFEGAVYKVGSTVMKKVMKY